MAESFRIQKRIQERCIASVAVQNDGKELEVTWNGGGVTRYWGYWLRLNSMNAGLFDDVSADWTDGANFHPQSRQILPELALTGARIGRDGASLLLSWPDGAESSVAAEALWTFEQGDPCASIEPLPWAAGHQWPRWPYSEVMDPDSGLLGTVLESYLREGVFFLTDVPRRVESLRGLAERISTLAPSHLGDEFHVRSADKPVHIGEVNAGIPLHIDLVYRQYPPNIQALHALRQVESGGENEFVDILNVVHQLSGNDRRLLGEHAVDFVADSRTVHFRGTAIKMRAIAPVMRASGRNW